MLTAWTEFLRDPESEKVRSFEMNVEEIRQAKDEIVRMSNDKEQREIYEMRSNLYGQLILPIKGSLYIETDSKKLELDKEKIFFLPPDCEHMFKAKENNECLTLDIDKQVLNNSDMAKLAGGKVLEFENKESKGAYG